MKDSSQPIRRKYGKPWTEGRHEDLAWLVETGENASGAARRFGLTYNALEKWCLRNAPEVWRVLVSREPCSLENRHQGFNRGSS